MNVISRILGALIALALTKIGAWLGVEFTEADVQTTTLWATAALVTLYGILHPLIRSRLVAWTGKGARVEPSPGVTDPMRPVAYREPPPDGPRAA